ncbi:hypothetical protein CH341_22385 [Rhodoplanes roseus]|uniref:Uncharacterized protein n=2 Tax=Rhodoplanes roseus TaxID=29409 RepID=A0A327KSY8_9BRAD|nr:hypothetical protein CH341_22385 [Rhodoplanes roseus]
MNPPPSGGVALADFPALRTFLYQPWTNWQGLFQGWFSPQITFGANLQDRGVEAHVLDTVGSYGKQLNTILDAISVMMAASKIDRPALSAEEQLALGRFDELARLADEAATQYQGKPHRGPLSEVNELLDDLAALKRVDAAAFNRIWNQIRDALPPAPRG